MFRAALVLMMAMIHCPPAALGQVSVSDTIVHFASGKKPTINVAVRNSAPDAVYVTAGALLLVDPSVDQTKTAPADNLLVSPKKFSIPGRGERTVRLLLRKRAPEKEQVYRVSFSPQERKFEEGEEERQKEGGIRLRILTGMGMLVFVDPAKPQSDLRWERKDGKIVFSNLGNVHVRLVDGKSCSEDKKDCIDLPSRRVYGGQTVEMPAPDNTILTFVSREGPSGDFRSLEVPALVNKAAVSGALREITPEATAENGRSY